MRKPASPYNVTGHRIVTCTNRSKSLKLPCGARCTEFLGNYTGTLGKAPNGILAFVAIKGRLWTVAT